MQSVLITGCHGLLGQKLVQLLTKQCEQVHGVDIHPHSLFDGVVNFTYHQLDITQRKLVIELVKETTPGAIINCAAMTNVDACEVEREKCWKLNVEALKFLIEGGRRTHSRIIQLSSDYVFDGKAGPYTELDRPNPLSYHGKSKLAAENMALGSGLDAAIVRTVVVFGHSRTPSGHGGELKQTFVSWLVSKLREGTDLKIVTDQISNVTLVDDLALAIRRILSLKKTGVYHVGGREIISRYDFALRVAEAYNLDPDKIRPTLTRMLKQIAERPLQNGLIVDKAQDELNITLSNVDEALKTYRDQEASFN